VGWFLNAIYLIGLTLALPWLLYRRWRKGKRIGGVRQKLFGSVLPSLSSQPRIWLHAVSVGEVLCLRPIIAALRQQFPDYQLVISVTTATGRQVAEKTFPDFLIFWFPFDFTWAVKRALRAVLPALVILSELELWPNFIRQASRTGVPVIVVNGRLGEKSFRGYRSLGWLARSMLRQVNFFAAQSIEYAKRLRALGVDEKKIAVTGSIKFDGVEGNRDHPKVTELRKLFDLGRSLTWIVGSTQEPEEKWALEIYREAVKMHSGLRLILVPRHPERFDAVAEMLQSSGLKFARRSQFSTTHHSPLTADQIILIDTLGELSYIWGLADLAFVGGSFNDRGGQNMIEPAAYGVPVMFGPNVWNFQQIADALLRDQAAFQVRTKDEWRVMTIHLLAKSDERVELGCRAREFVAKQQGAAKKTVEIVKQFLPSTPASRNQAA
jgi:3-deoxy-D-manno-octulosonic-acid transferase